MAGLIASIQLLLGAVSDQCPLEVSECKSVTVDHNVAARLQMYKDSRTGASKQVEGVTIDLGFRGGDQLVYDLKCRQKEVPYAIATSNDLYLRIQKKKNDKRWHVVQNVSVGEFKSLNCKKLAKLTTAKVPDQKEIDDTIKENAVACSNDKFTTNFGKLLGFRFCKEFPASMFLLPDTKFSDAMLKGEYKAAYHQMHYSVSALTVKQREHLDKARVAVFECNGKQAIAWVGLLKKSHKVLVITKKFNINNIPVGAKSLVELKKVHWDYKCKKIG